MNWISIRIVLQGSAKGRKYGEAVTIKFDLEIAKAVVAASLLLSISLTVFYYSQVRTGTIPAQLDRLVIVSPSELFLDREATLTIKAVDSKGSLMTSRNDLIEVALTQANASIGIRNGSQIIWSGRLNVRLQGGIAEVLLKGKTMETVIMTARQIDGETKLTEGIASLNIGYVG